MNFDLHLKRLQERVYTDKEEMKEFIVNCINGIAFRGLDTKSDELENLIDQLLRKKHHALVDIIYFLCKCQNGIGEIFKESTLDSGTEMSHLEFELSLYSDSDASDCTMTSIQQEQQEQVNCIAFESDKDIKEIVETITTRQFWNHEYCSEMEYCKHVLLCLIKSVPIGSLYFTSSKSSSLYFQSITDKMVLLKSFITTKKDYKYLESIGVIIDGKLQEYYELLSNLYFSISKSYHCDSDILFVSILVIKSKSLEYDLLFTQFVEYCQNPLVASFSMLENNSNDNNEITNVLNDYTQEFTISCCCINHTQLALLQRYSVYDNLAFITQNQAIIQNIATSTLLNTISNDSNVYSQINSIAALLKQQKDDIAYNLLQSELNHKNDIQQLITHPTLSHTISILCQTWMYNQYHYYRRSNHFLLDKSSNGSVAQDISLKSIPNTLIDASYSSLTIANNSTTIVLQIDLINCSIHSTNPLFNQLVTLHIQLCLIGYIKRIIHSSTMYLKKNYACYLTIKLHNCHHKIHQLIQNGQCDTIKLVQPLIQHVFENGCPPSDVIRKYLSLNSFKAH